MGRQLAAAAAERLASTPWVDAAQYADPVAETALAQAAHLVDPAATGSCGLGRAEPAGYEEEEGFCEADVWEEEPDVPASHLANALAALGLLAAPLAGGLEGAPGCCFPLSPCPALRPLPAASYVLPCRSTFDTSVLVQAGRRYGCT